MNSEDSELLIKVFSSVFEGFAFMFVEDEPDAVPRQPGDCVRAEIAFSSGSGGGSMEVVASQDFCSELAENILGAEEEELPEKAGENALKEVLNVSCGYLLAEKFGTQAVFDLSIPETSGVSEENWQQILENNLHTAFLVDESPLLARLVIQ
ncbi:MAG: hypothetical protein R6X08_02730 [Desulfosalsimonadaceae bacterium]